MNHRSGAVLVLALLVLASCNKREESVPLGEGLSEPRYDMAEKAMEAPASPGAMSPGEAVSPDRGAHFIRSAELQMRCRSVESSVARIERIVADVGGYLELSDTRRSTEESHRLPHGSDSTLEISRDGISGTIHARVPNQAMDSVVSRIASLAIVVHARTVRAQDVGAEVRRAERARLRNERASERIQGLSESGRGRIRDLAALDAQALSREERADEALGILDDLSGRVELSRVDVQLWQHPITAMDTVALPLSRIWKLGFFERSTRAIVSGWRAAQDIVVWMLSLWILWSFLILVVVALRIRRRFRRAGPDEIVA
ncbi:MAG: DUF4349 domain-containing protein [Fibrobacteria bacterium]|nr:DUF4349 domain-containing protein [Fibrobacteria bacterium]